MTVDGWLWAASTLITGGAVWRCAHRQKAQITSVMVWFSLAISMIALALGENPIGSTPAAILALSGAGMLGVVATNRTGLPRGEVIAILVAAGLCTFAATTTAVAFPGRVTPSASYDWLFGIRNALAAWGAAGMVVSVIRVAHDGLANGKRFATATLPIEAILPPSTTPVALTCACIVGGIWNLSTQATIWHASSGDAWLLSLWLMIAAERIAAAEWSEAQLAGWTRLVLAVVGGLAAVLILVSMPLL